MKVQSFNFRRPKIKPWSGSTNFPTSVDNKTALTDGVDYIEADNINNAYVPETASQTFIGAAGAAQSKCTDLIAQLVTLLPTIKLKYKDTATVTAVAGVCWAQNSGATIRVPRKNTSNTDVTFTNIDTGAEAASTRYYIWAIADATATTVTFKISTSASAPSGSTNYVLIGGFYNDGSSNVVEKSVWSVAGMRPVQFKYKLYTTSTSGTTVLPQDNTVPQNTEGDEYMLSDQIIPYASTNIFLIIVLCNIYYANVSQGTVALFQDTTAAALASTMLTSAGNTIGPGAQMLIHAMVTGATTATQFKVRAGTSSGTNYFNKSSGGDVMGGTLTSGILIMELEAA